MIKETTFAEQMDLIPTATVSAYLRKIDRALETRALFEKQKKKPAFIELQAAFDQMEGNKTLARFFAVMNCDPVEYLNKERKKGYRTNLKTVRKVRMLAEYMRGEHGAINGVCKALFAATILAAKHGKPWSSNSEAELLLFGMPTSQFQRNEELWKAYESFSMLNIRSGEEARNQACQFRTAFENLGVYFKSRESEDDLSTNGIYADMENPLIKALSTKWRL